MEPRREFREYIQSLIEKVELALDDTIPFSDSESAFDLKKVRVESLGIGAGKADIEWRTGTEFPITYVSNAVYGSPTSLFSGNISHSLIDAKLGVYVVLFHEDSEAPTLPGSFRQLSNSENYVPGRTNIFFIQYISDTTQIYTILQGKEEEIDCGFNITQISTKYSDEPLLIADISVIPASPEGFNVFVSVENAIETDEVEYRALNSLMEEITPWQSSEMLFIPQEFENQLIRIEVRDKWGRFDSADDISVMPTVLEEFVATSETGHTGDIQTYTVPFTANYRITAYGAGWGGVHQKGAKISGLFHLTEGEVLDILVGQLANNEWSGCGGTFVVKAGGNTNADILVIAGGSGGYSAGSPEGATHGQIGTAGGRSSGTTAVADNGDGGVQSGPAFAGSGAGFFGNGVGGDGTVAQAYINGGFGQISDIDARGGFGGGGTGRTDDRIAGGGGYSGGTSHGGSTGYGGGGGSFNSGSDTDNEAGVNEGAGKVIIETETLV